MTFKANTVCKNKIKDHKFVLKYLECFMYYEFYKRHLFSSKSLGVANPNVMKKSGNKDLLLA